MPRKVRELEADLQRAGFIRQAGKGSHRRWRYPQGPTVTISGGAGIDAERYQEKEVRQAIEAVKGK